MGNFGDIGISALASGAGSLSSNIADLPFNVLYMHMQEEANARQLGLENRMNRTNYDYSLSMSSPAQQVQRLKNAGLNPALAYGSAVGSSINHSVSGAQGKQTFAPTANTQASVSPQMIAQMRNIDADTSKKNEETIALQTENLHREEGILLDLEDKRADIAVKMSQSGLNDAQKNYYIKELDMLDQHIKESIQRVKESKQRVNESKAKTELTGYQAQREKTKHRFEKDFEERTGKPAPFELSLSPTGIATKAGAFGKGKVSRLIDRVKDRFGDIPTSSATELTERERGGLISYNKARVKQLHESYQKGTISQRKYDRTISQIKKECVKFGIYDNVF